MLEILGIENFKSLKNVTIDPGTITILIGPNSSGKSSVLQALGVLKQSLGHDNLVSDGDYIRLGDFEDIIIDHDISKILRIRLFGSFPIDRPKLSIHSTAKEIKSDYELIFDIKGLKSHQGTFAVDGLMFAGGWDVEKSSGSEFEKDNDKINISGYNEVGRPIITSGGSIGSRKTYEILKDEINYIIESMRYFLRNFRFVPALRGCDNLYYNLLDEPSFEFWTSKGLSAQSQLLASSLAYQRVQEKKLSKMIEKVLGIQIMGILAQYKQVGIESFTSEIQNNIINDGFAANQLVHLFLQLINTPHHSLVGIEEPEIHLHPRAQSALVDELVSIAKGENKQIIMTTHSEHILTQALINVAEKRLAPEQLAVYYFEKEKGASTVTRLKVSDDGALEGGLKGFFESNIDEVMRYMKVLSAKD